MFFCSSEKIPKFDAFTLERRKQLQRLLSHKSEVFWFPKLPSLHQTMPSSIVFALSYYFVSVFVNVTQTRVKQEEEPLVEGLPPLGCPVSKSAGIFLIDGYVGGLDYSGWLPPCEGGSGVCKTAGSHRSKPVSGIPPLPLLQFWPWGPFSLHQWWKSKLK